MISNSISAGAVGQAVINSDASHIDPSKAGTNPAIEMPYKPDLSELFATKHLSPELMLAFVQSRLNDIDAQVNDKIEAIRDRSARAEVLRAAKTRLSENLGFGDSENKIPMGMGHALRDDLETLRYQSSEPAVRAAATDLVNQHDTENKVTVDQLRAAIDKIDNALASLTADNEIESLKLQQLVQDRSQTISFASNVMSKLNESRAQIIGNIR